MPINVENNTSYAADLINEKYAPLGVNNVTFGDDERVQCTEFFQKRIAALQNGLLPRRLNLYAENWGPIREAEAANTALSPVVVVSSNRAAWIRKGDERAKFLEELGPETGFKNVNDVAALMEGSTPWYLPRRIHDDNRHVYIVVHRLEYDHYRDTLAGTGMTVIGWELADDDQPEIESSPGRMIRRSYVGFGASRFAALEFCKYLFNILLGVARPPDRQKAWLVDDNLVYVRGFPGFEPTEEVMTTNIWGLGFKAATNNSDDQEIRKMAGGEMTTATLTNLAEKGLLQQCVLWNVGQLNVHYVNYSPYFISSNEDTSLSNFLLNPSRLRLCEGASVFKGMAYEDGSNEDVAFLRNHAMEVYFAQEQNNLVRPLKNQGGEQTLLQYVKGHVLPNARKNMQNEDPMLTESKAVEQLMAKIVRDRPLWVPVATFRPNGNNLQATRIDPPL